MVNKDEISRFDLSDDEIANMDADEMKGYIAALRYERSQYVQDIHTLTKACREGDLQVQMDTSEYLTDLQSAGDAVNQMIHDLYTPIHLASEYIGDIAHGKIPEKIETVFSGDFNVITNNLNTCIDAVNLLVNDAGMIAKAAVEGNLETKADPTKHEGDFRKIIGDINETFDIITDKVVRYESILDAVPMAITVTDLDSKWTFVNKAVEQMLNRSRRELIGHPCNEWGANICNTDNCGIKRLKSGIPNTLFEQNGGHYKVDCAYISNSKGEKVGHVEVVGDITQITKVSQYLRQEVDHLAENLEKLANGNINCSYDVAPSDEHTKEVASLFETINISLKEVTNAISSMVSDAKLLSNAALNGKLETRADITRHKGEYQKIVEGVNETLDAVINPLNVAAKYVDRISRGDIPSKITETYNGDFNIIKTNLNTCIDAVNLLVSDAGVLAKAAVEGKLETRADPTKHEGDFRKIVEGVNDTLDSVINPLNVAADYVDRISKGDIPVKITDSYNGDFNVIKNNLNTCIEAVNLLVSDAGMLAKAAVEGKLETRADATKHQGDFRKIVEGVNDTLDAVINPLNVAADYVERISQGDIPVKITDSYNGDFNVIKNNLNTCIDAVNLLVSDAGMLAKAAVEGKLDTRADDTKHQGDFREVVKGVNQTLDSVIGPLNVAAEYVDRISKGDIPQKITDSYNGDFNEIKNNLNTCIDAVNLLVSDAGMLAKAAVEGKLDTRADDTKHQGDFREVVKGVNQTLDSVIGPLNVAAEYVDRISKGDIPQKITDSYNGDFNEIKNNLNTCIDAVNLLVSDAGMLAKAAVEGKLETRADATKHQGDFREIVEGVNDTLDAVINPLNVAANYVDRISKGDIPVKITDSYNGDFNVIKSNLNTCIDAVNLLVSDANLLAKAAVEGKLETRADDTKHQGDFKVIVKGVNDTLNAVINPLNVAANYVDRISKGDIPVKITDSYNGDFNIIKNNLNTCIDAVNLLVSDANLLAKAALDGKLETRADASKHRGDFQKIVIGVNDTLDSVIVPVKEALRVSKEYANYQFRARVDPSLKVAGDWIEFKNVLDNIGIQIGSAVGMINNQLLTLASNAEEATASIEEVSAGAQQIAKNAGGVSLNAERGNDGITQVLKAMEDLTITVSEVSQRAEQVSTTATQANEFSRMGIDLAKRSELSMTEITRSSVEVDQIVKDINQQMEEIGKIVRLISDIANQTNLLALNAAIEAARAGEAGRGFAVVAAEVKSLAQDSRQSAENIADMISTLQDKAKKATIAMGQAGEKVEEGSKSLTETLGAFNKIASSIEDITRNAMDVASASEEQAASVEEVTASINEVSILIVNTSTEAGDAAAATQEASASIEQISKIVSNVSGAVDSVASEMAKFVV